MNSTRKKTINIIICITILSGFITSIAANETKFENKEDSYTEGCFLSNEQIYSEQECAEFEEYLISKENKFKDELTDIDFEKDDVQQNIEEYIGKIQEYDKHVEDINKKIALLETNNQPTEEQLTQMTMEIKDLLAQYEKDYNKMKDKLVSLQSYLGTNYKLNHKIKSKNAIDNELYTSIMIQTYKSDIKKIKSLEKEINIITDNQKKQSANSSKMEKRKELLSDSKSLVADLRAQTNKILIIFKQQESEIIGKRTKTLTNLDSVKEIMEKNKTNLSRLKPSEGWTLPIAKGSYTLSAGAWNYPEEFGGGIHLGVDLAASIGTTIVAPANGVILYSSNTCDNTGKLGNWCGTPGVNGGGNQTFLLTTVQNKMFVLYFCHMNGNSPLETGTIVNAGEKIGEVGLSGNTSGAHSHIEMFFVGKGNDLSGFVSNWNGDMSFGNKWGSEGLTNTCNGTIDKTHCRVNPLEIIDF